MDSLTGGERTNRRDRECQRDRARPSEDARGDGAQVFAMYFVTRRDDALMESFSGKIVAELGSSTS